MKVRKPLPVCPQGGSKSRGEGEELREGEGQEGEAEAELLGFGLSGS